MTESGAVVKVEDVYLRLDTLGYSVVPEDARTIEYLIDKIVNKIELNTNCVTFPEQLLQMAIDIICGEFLYGKYAIGQLEGYDFNGAIKRISEGDTTVEYAYGSGSKTPEERFVAYLDKLRKLDKDMLAAVRRMRW